MKLQSFLHRTLFGCIVLGTTWLTASRTQAQDIYRFRCRDYVSTDNNRAPQSAFGYDDEANTFTVTSSGQNNIAFKMDNRTDGNYYINNSQDWFLVQGTHLATSAGSSYIWWFNGYNGNGNQTPPTLTADNGDGTTCILWDIRRTAGINANMDFNAPEIFISSNGQGFIHAMGLTSTSGSSTIRHIGYHAKYEVAALYPSLLAALDYTETTLTEEIKARLSRTIDESAQILEGDADSESKQTATEAVRKAQNIHDTAGATEYATVYEALNSLCAAMNYYQAHVTDFSWEKTPNGLHATLNEKHIRLTLYADDILRVCKGVDETPDKTSLSVILAPDHGTTFEVNEDKEQQTVTIGTNKIKAVYHLTTGQVEILRYNGAELLREKQNGSSFFPFKDGPKDSYRLSLTFQLDDNEKIFGMGQIQDGLLNRRGQTFSLQQDNKKVCIPYFQSSKGYGLFWDNYSPTTFTDNEEGTRFQSTGREIDYYVLAGEESNDVPAAMRRLTGKAPMMPLWNFGLYQSRERYTSAREVMDVLDEYRKRNVPLDCMIQDWQYWGDNAHWNALEFLNPSFGNYDEMIGHIHDNHAKLMISIWANFGPATRPYAAMNAKGRLIPVESYPQKCGVRPYDVYGKEARDIYWDFLYNGLVNKGIDAYWMDSSEPDYFNWQNADLDYVTETGQTWRSLRNAFPLAHVSGVHDHHRTAEAQGDAMLKGKRVSILTRSAFAGQQRYGANTWSGDVVASWENLAAQIPAGCNLSVCGIPYWNSDIGGFFLGSFKGIDDPAWRRLYMRWMQFGTFTPMMRFHGTQTPREIYQFGAEGDGRGDYDQILKYIRMRYRMLPYLYSTAWQVHRHDASFMRALPVAFGDDTEGYDITDEYMFGDAFLVAPIVKDAAGGRDVYLPAGHRWTDFWTGETFDGGQHITKYAAVDIMPLYVRAGSILPWGPDVQYSTEKPWDDLEIRVYPGADGRFTLYEDENDNYNYERGEYTEIPFEWNDRTRTLTIGARNGSFKGMPATRTFRICKVSARRGTGDLHETRYEAVIHYDGTPVSVRLDSEDASVLYTDVTAQYIVNPSFEADGGTLNQKAPKGWNTDCRTAWWGVNRGGGNGDPMATDGQYIFGVWDSSHTAQAEISQTIKNLPEGSYRLTVDMHASHQNSTPRVGRQRLFAGENEALFRDQIMTPGGSDMHPLQTVGLDFTVTAADRPLTIGVTTSDSENETWFKIDNFRLYRVERPVVNLDENKAYAPGMQGITDIDLVQRLTTQSWNTFCVPFSLSAEETARHFSEVKTFASVSQDETGCVLDFRNASSIRAGLPCLVKPTEETGRMMFTDAVIDHNEIPEVTTGHITFKGTYSPTALRDEEFHLADDIFQRAVQPRTISGYHAYIILHEGHLSDPERITISIDGKPTDISVTPQDKVRKTADVYNTSGVCLSKGANTEKALKELPRGIYIINGKKVAR